jgi:hypothetical protein
MVYVRSHKFCCCVRPHHNMCIGPANRTLLQLPVRFGVFVMSLGSLLLAGVIAAGGFLAIHQYSALWSFQRHTDCSPFFLVSGRSNGRDVGPEDGALDRLSLLQHHGPRLSLRFRRVPQPATRPCFHLLRCILDPSIGQHCQRRILSLPPLPRGPQ